LPPNPLSDIREFLVIPNAFGVKKSLQKARRLFSGSTFNIAEKQAQPPERYFELLLFSAPFESPALFQL